MKTWFLLGLLWLYGCGPSDPAQETVTPPPIVEPPPPLIEPTVMVVLEWNVNRDAIDGYYIFRNKDCASGPVLLAFTTETLLVDFPPYAWGRVCYWATAMRNDGTQSPYSQPAEKIFE